MLLMTLSLGCGDRIDEIEDIMQKYPKGNCRYEWLQSYFEENMSKDFFEVPMASETVKLLNMFFGVCLGQHFVLDKEDEVKPWFVAYGEPKSGKGIPGTVLQKLIPECSVIVPDTTAFAKQQFFRGDRLMWTCRVPDPTGPLYNTLDFRCFDHGAFSTNIKNRDFKPAITSMGEVLPVPTGNVDLNDPSLLVRPTETKHGLMAIARRSAPYRYTTTYNDEQPVKYNADPSLKLLPGLDEPRLVILVKNCFHRLRVEMFRTSLSIVNIYPDIADGGDELCSKGYLFGKQLQLVTDIRNQQAKMDNVELYVREGLEECPGSYVLIDKLYDEVAPSFSKRLGKRQFYKIIIEVAKQCSALVQVQHKATLNLCSTAGITGHLFAPTCCENSSAGGPQTYKVLTNCKWVS